jgi:hypothetical protein
VRKKDKNTALHNLVGSANYIYVVVGLYFRVVSPFHILRGVELFFCYFRNCNFQTTSFRHIFLFFRYAGSALLVTAAAAAVVDDCVASLRKLCKEHVHFRVNFQNRIFNNLQLHKISPRKNNIYSVNAAPFSDKLPEPNR